MYTYNGHPNLGNSTSISLLFGICECTCGSKPGHRPAESLTPASMPSRSGNPYELESYDSDSPSSVPGRDWYRYMAIAITEQTNIVRHGSVTPVILGTALATMKKLCFELQVSHKSWTNEIMWVTGVEPSEVMNVSMLHRWTP